MPVSQIVEHFPLTLSELQPYWLSVRAPETPGSTQTLGLYPLLSLSGQALPLPSAFLAELPANHSLDLNSSVGSWEKPSLPPKLGYIHNALTDNTL